MTDLFTHIEGLGGNVPTAAVVSVGRKGPRGAPVERDRFFILHPDAESKSFAKKDGGTYDALQRPLHSRFKIWNDKAAANAPECATLLGNIVFPTEAQSWVAHLRAQQLGKAAGTPPGGGTYATPPGGRPACTGDGRRASRFNGVLDGECQYLDIACPNDLCHFRQEIGGARICKPFGRLYFMLRWPQESQLPRVLAKWTTASWANVSNVRGLFDYVLQFGREAGIDNPNLMGLPFVMTLNTKSKPEKGRSFPVVHFSVDGDLLDFFANQRKRLQLAGGGPVRLLGGNTDPAELDAEVIDLDVDTILPGPGLPASVATVAPDAEQPSLPLAPAVRNASAEAVALGRQLLGLVAGKDDAAALLSELLTVDGVPGPRTSRDLTLDQIDLALERLKAHPLAVGAT